MERRSLIRKGARLLMTGALLAAAGYLLASGRVTPGHACGENRGCANCRRYQECDSKNSGHGRR